MEKITMINNITLWLDETAKRFPDKLAYADEQKGLTFAQVRENTLALAQKIVERGLFKEPIAVYMEKSVDVLVAFFAAAYSGNFYSPIDIHMPQSRIEKIFEYLRPSLIISKREYAAAIRSNERDAEVIYMEDVLEKQNMENTFVDYTAVYSQRDRTCDTDLLYVLFTSGSTGVPKGVTICHRSVVDYIDNIAELFSFTESDVFGNQAPFYFDNSVLDIYTTLKTGATMQVIPEKLFSWPLPLLEYVDARKVNTIFWVPFALEMLSKLKALRAYDMRGKLKRVLFAGEVMPNKCLNYWRKNLPDAVFANLYGPTEITVDCTCYIVDRAFSDEEPLPIGKPMKNTDILVLDEQNRLVKTEADGMGELCVRGTSLSLGYYNNPEKTKEAFVQNPLNTAYPELIYRTGDLVRYNEYGELMYLSRKDFQIKHLGHRIELGEIETAVSSLDGISLCCCLYDERRSRIVLFTEGTFALETINEKLGKMIPEYMLPGRIICLAQMPINANGKIDRVKLGEML